MATEPLTQPLRGGSGGSSPGQTLRESGGSSAEAAPRPSAQPLIDLREAGVSYPGQPEPALRPISLAVRHGELVTLTGPTGSGKSTLLSVVGLLLRPTTGAYLLNGADTARLADRERTALRGRLIGFVFQRPQLLLARSALDNVMVPALYAGMTRQERVSAATESLERVGLRGRPHVTVSELPASERQRVAIARAIVTDPSLLLCDDPTASLDDDTASQIISLLVSLHKDGTTVLVATRDQLAAAHSSRRLGVTAGGHAGALETGA